MAVLGLRFCARAFSSCGKRGPLLIAVCGPLTIVASLVGSTGSRRAASVVVAHGPSCSTACGIFPDQGSNPCPLHCQADSQPLRHQGSPIFSFDVSLYGLFYQSELEKELKIFLDASSGWIRYIFLHMLFLKLDLELLPVVARTVPKMISPIFSHLCCLAHYINWSWRSSDFGEWVLCGVFFMEKCFVSLWWTHSSLQRQW